MSSTDNPTTFTECQTALLNVLREPTSSTALVDLAGRYLNIALHDVHAERWWWAERYDRLETHARYTTGTLAIALAARTAVTGTSTLWNTAVTGMGFNNVRAGGKLLFSGATHVYPVASVASDTSLTLTEPFIGDTALSGASYTYYEDEYGLAADFDDEHGIVDALHFPADRKIRIIPSSDFFRRFTRNSGPATRPRFATIIHQGPSGSTDRRPRLVLAPPPSLQDSIPYRYYTKHLAVSSAGVGAENLSATTDHPIMPLKWRYGLVYKAAELWMLDRKADARVSEYKGRYEGLMLRARQSSDSADNRPRIEPSVGYFARAPGRSVVRPRYSTGTEFEDLRI